MNVEDLSSEQHWYDVLLEKLPKNIKKNLVKGSVLDDALHIFAEDLSFEWKEINKIMESLETGKK